MIVYYILAYVLMAAFLLSDYLNTSIGSKSKEDSILYGSTMPTITKVIIPLMAPYSIPVWIAFYLGSQVKVKDIFFTRSSVAPKKEVEEYSIPHTDLFKIDTEQIQYHLSLAYEPMYLHDIDIEERGGDAIFMTVTLKKDPNAPYMDDSAALLYIHHQGEWHLGKYIGREVEEESVNIITRAINDYVTS
jgi:hypothetical protein